MPDVDAVAQETLTATPPTDASEGSPPDDALVADAAADDLDNEIGAEDEGPEPVVLTKAKYDQLMADAADKQEVQREKARLAYEQDEAKRASALAKATARANGQIKLWEDRLSGDPDEDRKVVGEIRRWERWLAGEHLRDKDERLDQLAYIADHAARPNWVRQMVEQHSLTESQAKKVMARATNDPAGAQAMAEVFGEFNEEKAREIAKKKGLTKQAVGKAVKGALDEKAVSRGAADSMGGTGTPSLTSKWNEMSSREKLKALLPGTFR